MYEFDTSKPYFKKSVFGKNPLVKHIAVEKFIHGPKTLLIEKETGSWCFLEQSEMNVYKYINNQTFDNVHQKFSQYTSKAMVNFLIRLYWLGIIKIADRRFFVPETFRSSPISESGPLFIILPTNKCNFSCTYCFADALKSPAKDMDWQTAEKTIDLILAYPSDFGTIEFAGGEPLLKFDLIRKIIDRVIKQAHKKGKTYKFNIQSNGTLINEEMAEFIRKYNIDISFSLDGDPTLNNITRYSKSPEGTYNAIIKGMDTVGQGMQNFGVICVISKINARKIRRILDHFSSLGLLQFKMNPVCKLGRASKAWNKLSLNAGEFLEVHKDYLRYAMKNNNPIIEDNTQFMLKNMGQKMHSYRCMRAQCGAGKSFFTIDPHGEIFPCDRYRKDPKLSLGNVNHARRLSDLYQQNDLVQELLTREAEAIDECRICPYKRLCEAGCSYETRIYSKELQSPHPWCSYYRGIFSALFKTIAEDKNFVKKFGIKANIVNRHLL
jgi:radical SAM protein with 4Fe4S-binding SPASM domain